MRSFSVAVTDTEMRQYAGYFTGVVIAYEAVPAEIYTVRYLDGDEEHMSLTQLRSVLVQ
jgi:hypothetical protein